MRETEQARAESAKRMEEIISLRPFPGKFEECVRRAEAAETERDNLRSRVEALEQKLAAAEAEIP